MMPIFTSFKKIWMGAGQLVRYLNFNFIFFSESTCTVNLWPTRRIRGRLVYMTYSVNTRGHFQKEFIRNQLNIYFLKTHELTKVRLGKSTS